MMLEEGARTTDLLVILAHPDDESFAMGGTLARYAAAGAVVRLIDATRGEAGILSQAPEAAGQIRQAELERAASVLGVHEVRFLGYRDGTLAWVEPTTAIERLAAILDELRPRAVMTFGPDGISGHPDHVTVGAWVTAAFERTGAAGWGARLFYRALAGHAARLRGPARSTDCGRAGRVHGRRSVPGHKGARGPVPCQPEPAFPG